MDFISRMNEFLNQSSEFKAWFLVFGCFPSVFIILLLFLLFGVGLKVLQFGWNGKDLNLMQFLYDVREKSANIRTGVWLKTSVIKVCNSKTNPCQSNKLNCLKNGCSFNKFDLVPKSKLSVDPDRDVKNEDKDAVFLEDDFVRNEEKEYYPEDGEFDIMELRKLVKIERKYKNEALAELEKERMAAATAAQEAMAMIFRLQSEKSSVEIQANQFRRMVEEKQQYDQDILESLQRIIGDCESEEERSLNEQEQLCF